MHESKTHVFTDPRTLGDLRRIVIATQSLEGSVPVKITHLVGNQRDPGYTTITVNEK